MTEELTTKQSSQWRDVWLQFKTHRGAVIGMIVFFLIGFLVAFGPLFWTLDPNFIDIRARNQGPSLLPVSYTHLTLPTILHV